MDDKQLLNEVTKLINLVKPSKMALEIAIKKSIEMINNSGKEPEYILDKYKQYLDQWDYNNGNHDEVYLKKDKLKKSLFDFLWNNSWKDDFTIRLNKRDRYFFGNTDPFKLEEALKVFLTKIKLPYETKQD